MATEANIKSRDIYVYFLYSEEQLKDRTKIEKSMSRVFTPGTVVVNGRKYKFTEMSRKTTNRYPDCRIIAQGIKSKMRYTDPTAN